MPPKHGKKKGASKRLPREEEQDEQLDRETQLEFSRPHWEALSLDERRSHLQLSLDLLEKALAAADAGATRGTCPRRAGLREGLGQQGAEQSRIDSRTGGTSFPTARPHSSPAVPRPALASGPAAGRLSRRAGCRTRGTGLSWRSLWG